MIINTDVETFIWVYVSTSLKFIPVHTKPGISHNTSEVTWWDLNPESWQIMIKDYSPLMCLYPRYLCLASWKQGYIGDFISSIILFRLVRLTQWVSDSFPTAPACCCCCSSLKSATFVFVSTSLCSADCCGVAFKGQSDAPGGSAVIVVAAVSTATRRRWGEGSQVAERWHRRRPLTATAAAPPSMTATRCVVILMYGMQVFVSISACCISSQLI